MNDALGTGAAISRWQFWRALIADGDEIVDIDGHPAVVRDVVADALDARAQELVHENRLGTASFLHFIANRTRYGEVPHKKATASAADEIDTVFTRLTGCRP